MWAADGGREQSVTVLKPYGEELILNNVTSTYHTSYLVGIL